MNGGDAKPQMRLAGRAGDATDVQATTLETARRISAPACQADRSPATTAGQRAARATRRGTDRVRPSELTIQATAQGAGPGIDPLNGLARRTRHRSVDAVAVSRRAVSDRSLPLSRVSTFSLNRHTPTEADRPGIVRHRQLGNACAPACQEVPNR